MSSWLIFMQVILDIGLLLGMFLIWARFSRPMKEDARLSKGLQLLQSKISILEDLSDRTDVQVRQLSALLTAKAVEVQQKTAEADRQIQAIEKNMQKSLDLAKIFQDKIPHKEIIERETSYKYIEAARMANQGRSADEISRKLEIPAGEVDVIINMNRDQLIFKEDEVPSWANPRAPREFAPESAVAPLKEFGTVTVELQESTFPGYSPGASVSPSPAVELPPITATTVNPIYDRPAITLGQPDNPGIKAYEFPRLDTLTITTKKSY
jgi:hypothetical protein